jgi:hypothetical protein
MSECRLRPLYVHSAIYLLRRFTGSAAANYGYGNEWQGPEAEADEMWSFVQSKQQQRWLWHAIDHETREIFAYVLLV